MLILRSRKFSPSQGWGVPRVVQTAAKRTGLQPIGVSADHQNYRWWALSCTSLGMLLAATNSGTLIIALPDPGAQRAREPLALVWVILAYLIAATVLVLMAGRLSRPVRAQARLRRRLRCCSRFAWLGAGFSSGATQLIVWRVLQGDRLGASCSRTPPRW